MDLELRKLRRQEKYDKVQKLADAKGVSIYEVSKATGISASTFTDWKYGRSEPKTEKMSALAEYFGVSIKYLIERGE